MDFYPFQFKDTFEIVLASYRNFETRTSLADEKLPAIELVRKVVCEKIGKFTKSEIMELVPSLSKASVENSLTQFRIWIKPIWQHTEEKRNRMGNGFYVR